MSMTRLGPSSARPERVGASLRFKIRGVRFLWRREQAEVLNLLVDENRRPEDARLVSRNAQKSAARVRPCVHLVLPVLGIGRFAQIADPVIVAHSVNVVYCIRGVLPLSV